MQVAKGHLSVWALRLAYSVWSNHRFLFIAAVALGTQRAQTDGGYQERPHQQGQNGERNPPVSQVVQPSNREKNPRHNIGEKSHSPCRPATLQQQIVEMPTISVQRG